MKPIQNRHDILFLYDVTLGNPNGDPDNGNAPRVDINTGLGLVTDVCLKRKIRNYVMRHPPLGRSGYDILIRPSQIIETVQKAAHTQMQTELNGKHSPEEQARRMRDIICAANFDVRAFGQVVSTGKGHALAGSPYGQIRGPVSVSFSKTVNQITPVEHPITRVNSTSEAKEGDDQKQRTMGQKHVVSYGLYRAYITVTPALARDTGFSQVDYEFLIEALQNMLAEDLSSARPDMVVRGILDFEHVGTSKQPDSDVGLRERALGCAHRQRLMDCIQLRQRDLMTTPAGYSDFEITVDWDDSSLDSRFPGVQLHRHVDPCSWATSDEFVAAGSR